MCDFLSLGNQKWSLNRGEQSYSLCVYGSVVLIGSYEMKIAVLDINTGMAFVGDLIVHSGSAGVIARDF